MLEVWPERQSVLGLHGIGGDVIGCLVATEQGPWSRLGMPFEVTSA